MKRTLVVAVLLMIGLGQSSQAQVGTSGLANAASLGQTVYGLGFAAGWTSGVGVSFRAHLPNKSSFQGVFGIIKTSDKFSMSIGGEYQYDLVRGATTRFFASAGAGFFYSGVDKNDVEGPFRAGVGLGGEFHIRESFHVSVGGMYVFSSDGSVLPLPQVAAHYYFN